MVVFAGCLWFGSFLCVCFCVLGGSSDGGERVVMDRKGWGAMRERQNEANVEEVQNKARKGMRSQAK